MILYPHILGCLLGTAVDDAAGLRREGLTPTRARRLYGENVSPDLLFGRGLCSDDTEHAVMVARSLALAHDAPDKFERLMIGQLKRWILSAPAGVGWATLRACLKLLVGLGPQRSGVYSAGNGPAMRSALLGLCAKTDDHCRELVRRSTRLTHTDPKANEGALAVARAAGLAARGNPTAPVEFLRSEIAQVRGHELRERFELACCSLDEGLSPAEYVAKLGWVRGVSGYVNETVPVAIYCWAASPYDYRKCITSAVLAGGDTDTVAAIAGAIAGANLGVEAIPNEWIEKLIEWPRTVTWMKQLASVLAENLDGNHVANPPSMRWLPTLPRNAAFAATVLGLGFRRLLPPY